MELSSKKTRTVNHATKSGGRLVLNARTLTQISLLSALAAILMLFEIPLWFAPSFYHLVLTELPVLIGRFAMGPMAGVLIELVKNLLKLIFNGTLTGGVGEGANFLIGCAFIVPSAIIYHRNKTKKGALMGMIIGTITLTIIGCFLNAYILLPVYSKAFGLPLDALIEMGTAINPRITSIRSLVILAVAPFNLLKGVVVSIITSVLYKKISPILHG